MFIYLYNEIPAEDLDLDRVVAYLSRTCSFAELEVRGNFIAHFYSIKLLKELAGIWHTDLLGDGVRSLTENERFVFEQNAYQRPETISSQVVYHGWLLEELLQSQLSHNETYLDQLHIALTPRLMVTKDDMDRRYHARTILSAQPSIISSSGLVEAPARSAEYYAFQAGYKMMGREIPDDVLKKNFAGQFLDYHDPRLTEVMLGYILQAIAYRFFGEGYCDNPSCRLFNAHRQHEMLTAQLEPPEFCQQHQSLFYRG